MAETLFDNTKICLGARIEFVYQWSKWMNSFNQCIQSSPIVSEQLPCNQSIDPLLQSNVSLLQSNTACTQANDPLLANEFLTFQSEFREQITSSKQKENRNPISLSSILNSNAYGKRVIETYNRDKSLNDDSRKLLVDSVLQYCIANDHDLSVADCALLSNEISEEFTGEDAVHYHSFFLYFFVSISLFSIKLAK